EDRLERLFANTWIDFPRAAGGSRHPRAPIKPHYAEREASPAEPISSKNRESWRRHSRLLFHGAVKDCQRTAESLNLIRQIKGTRKKRSRDEPSKLRCPVSPDNSKKTQTSCG